MSCRDVDIWVDALPLKVGGGLVIEFESCKAVDGREGVVGDVDGDDAGGGDCDNDTAFDLDLA